MLGNKASNPNQVSAVRMIILIIKKISFILFDRVFKLSTNNNVAFYHKANKNFELLILSNVF